MNIEGYEMPEGLYYEENHYWIKEEGDILIMGMDDFAQKLAGDIMFVKLPPEGKKLTKGKKFSQVESGKWLGKVYAPVSGVLVASNNELETAPGLINQDCYGKGWMYRIKPDDLSEVKALIHGAEKVKNWLLADIEKYKQA